MPSNLPADPKHPGGPPRTLLVKLPDKGLAAAGLEEVIAARCAWLDELLRADEALQDGLISVRSAFSQPARAAALMRRAARTTPGFLDEAPDLLAWLRLRFHTHLGARRARELLRRDDHVEYVIMEHAPPQPPSTGVAWPTAVEQRHLRAAPEGLGVLELYAPGHDGDGVRFGDLERGWWLTEDGALAHPDHPPLAVTLRGTNDHNHQGHGTAVLGLVLAQVEDPPSGCRGVAPAAGPVSLYGVSDAAADHDVDAEFVGLAELLCLTSPELRAGDVLLIEEQVTVSTDSGDKLAPAEARRDVFDVVRALVACDIVVVAAAGNGGANLDAVVVSAGEGSRSLGRSPEHDSGAILVTAGQWTQERWIRRDESWNRGSRVDCFADGSTRSTGRSTPPLADPADEPPPAEVAESREFGDTSAAAALIAGAAIATQAMARAASGGRPLLPAELRALLSRLGTPGQRGMGVMPDLTRIQNHLLGRPDVYLRDHAGDRGADLTARRFASPDILFAAVDPGPDAAAWAAALHEGSPSGPGDPLTPSDTAAFYVRVQVTTPEAATEVRVSLYTCSPTCGPPMSGWTLLGSATAASAPGGHQPTLLGPILASPDRLPLPADHSLSLLALVSAATDPPIQLIDLDAVHGLEHHVRCSNNLAFRCAAPVELAPEVGPLGAVLRASLRCQVQGGPSGGQTRTRLEVQHDLPEAASLLLDLPTALLRNLLLSSTVTAATAGADEAPLAAGYRRFRPPRSGDWSPIGSQFSAAARETLPHVLLHVRLPADAAPGPYRLALRETYEGVEIGRFTWSLRTPPVIS